MRKQIKKALAFLGAAAMSVGLIATTPAIDAHAEGETVAYISFADGSWGDAQYWYDGNEYAVKATTADVTDYGQYTVSLDFTGTEAGKAADTAFFDVEIANGEAAFPNSYMQIDSVKINGNEVEVGKTYTSSDDGVATRTNLYNEWVPEVAEGRTADGSSDVTATPVDKAVVVDVETLEITFTLMEGVAFGGDAVAPTVEGPVYATLNINTVDWSEYTKEIEPVEITGDGEYSVEMKMADGIQLGQFNALEIENGELVMGTASVVTVTSIELNGEAIELAGPSYTCSADGGAKTTRVNLYNEWNAPDPEAVAGDDSHKDHRIAEGDLTAATAMIIPADKTYAGEYTITSIKVNFTVSNYGVNAEGGAAEEKPIPTEFTAFVMFSDGSGAWENYNQGVGTEATVTGDGVYEVSLSAAQCGATGKAAPVESGLVFLVDITDLGTAMMAQGTLREAEDERLVDTDAKVKVAIFVDGVQIAAKSKNVVLGDIEGNGRFRLDFFNPYDGSGTESNPVASPADLTPESEIKVVFSIEGTGLNTGADTDLDAYLVAKGYVEAAADDTTAPAEDATTAPAPEKSGSNNVIIIVIVAVVVVIAGVVAAILGKKKKSDK